MVLSSTDLEAIAKVSLGRVPKGTAFLVGPKLAITAAHVIRGATTAIHLTFPRAESDAKPIQGISPGLDWALLELETPIAADPLRLTAFDRWHDRTWATHGYGGLYAASATGGPIKGDFYSESPDKLEVRCTEIATEAEAAGYSGGPLITSSGTVGLIRYTRMAPAGQVKGGYFAVVTARAILADWPSSHASAKPRTQRAPYVQVLRASLGQRDCVENAAVREKLCQAVQLPTPEPAVAAERIAERLVELPWNEIYALIDALSTYATSDLKDLLCSMWVPREAAKQLAALIEEISLPVIETKAQCSVRQHVMRAQGEQDIDSLIEWRILKQRMFYANVGSGETLEVVVEKALSAALLSTDPEELREYAESYDPLFVSVQKVPTDAELAAVRQRFGPKLRLIGYSELVTTPMLAASPSAKLVEPRPDRDAEKSAKSRTPPEFK